MKPTFVLEYDFNLTLKFIKLHKTITYFFLKVQSHRKTTWHVAQHYCVEQNSQLLRSEADFLQDYTNETKKYWIALFRQQTTVWGSGKVFSVTMDVLLIILTYDT